MRNRHKSEPQLGELYSHTGRAIQCVAQNGVVVELRKTTASQNCHSCQFADKQDERGYYDESDFVLCMN